MAKLDAEQQKNAPRLDLEFTHPRVDLPCSDCGGLLVRKYYAGPMPVRCGTHRDRRDSHRNSGTNKVRRVDRKALGLRESRSKQHGLSDEAYLALVAPGACEVCQSPEPGGRGDWHIDHDHACCAGSYGCQNCVRGLLCHYCNLALGMVKDDPAIAEALARYLRGHNGQA